MATSKSNVKKISRLDQSQRFDPLLECLVIMTRLHDKPRSATALSAGLPREDGLFTPDLLLRAAQRHNFSAQILQRPLVDIQAMSLPVILILKNQQACILTRFDHDAAEVIQPESGTGAKKIPYDELDDNYAGHTIFIEPNYEFDDRTAVSAHTPKGHWFWSTIQQHWPTYSEVLLASFLVNLFILAMPLFIMNVYDRVVPNHAVATLWVLAIGIGLVFIFDFILRTLRAYFIDQTSKKIDSTLSSYIFEHLLAMNMAQRPQSVGSLNNTVHSFESFREFITSASISLLIDLPFVLLFIAVIAMLGGTLALIPLFIIPFVLGITWLLQKSLRPLIKENFRYAAEKQATLFESLNGVETIKTLSAEGTLQGRWEKIICRAAAVNSKLHLLGTTNTNLSLFIQQLGSVLVVIAGVYKISGGHLTVGGLIACTILTGRALAPMTQVVGLLMRYQQSKEALLSLDAIMQVPSERPLQQTPLQHPHLTGAIEFQHVSFHYPDQKLAALDDISFKIKPGERVGIIGRIGSGKTTLEKLLLHLYEPDNGNILLDGTAIGQYDIADLRRDMGYVPQDVMLFYGSIKDNIVYSAPYASDETILRAAELSGIASFIQRHPDGFDLQVGEGGRCLSGGQRQAVAIARALLRDPPILVMDEPTNSMDDRTEASFKEHLQPYLNGKTLILITHRGSMLSLVHRLIILDAGRVIADGSKEKVLTALAEGKIKAR